MKRRFRVLILAASASLMVAATVVWAGEPDSSHHSLRYQLWKRGRYSFRDGFKEAFMADVDRGSIVLGKRRVDLEKTFAPLTEGKKNDRYWSDVYRRFRADDQFLWLWDSNWLLVLRDGRAIHVRYLKG